MMLVLLVILAGCTSASPSEPLALPPPPPPPAPVAAPAVPRAAAAAVVKRFDHANAKEPSVVFSPGITREQIEDIHTADHATRRALSALGRQGDHMTPAALRKAHDAVVRLEKTLEQR